MIKIPVKQAGRTQLAGLGALGSLGWADPHSRGRVWPVGSFCFLNNP